MKAVGFAYWLQGAFELVGVDKFAAKHLKCIKHHLGRLRGGVDFISEGSAGQVVTVRLRPSNFFLHVVDKRYGSDLAKAAALNHAHQRGRPRRPDAVLTQKPHRRRPTIHSSARALAHAARVGVVVDIGGRAACGNRHSRPPAPNPLDIWAD